MRIEIHAPASIEFSEACDIRVLLLNDSYEPVTVSRNALVGPNLRGLTPAGFPYPASVEPTFGGQDEPLTLQPFTFYGRERTYRDLPLGEVEITAHYKAGGGKRDLSASRHLQIKRG